jgi:Na+/H+ antiporter NhaD/arsenite permease-like protein
LIITLIIALVIYSTMIFSTLRRTLIAVLGSATLLIYGSLSGTFSAKLAFERFPKEIIMLLIVLSLFTKVFENIGVFDYIGEKFSHVSKGKKSLLVILIVMMMYITSLFMNNLSVVLLFTFVCITLALEFKLPVVPVLVAGLIASNIGGAALPWADTPAVILTLYTDFSIMDFLTKLFLPCFVYALLLSGYTVVWCKHYKYHPLIREKIELKDRGHRKLPAPHMDKMHIKKPPSKRFDKKAIKIPIILFVLFISSICIAPFLDISIAYVSMFFGAGLLIINKDNPDEVLNSLAILDTLTFITALFLIGGVLEYSGIMKIIVEYILMFTNGNIILIILAILISAFVISTFLSAGPAAATLLPICVGLNIVVGHNLVYAALAFGILAGSSMFPWSATGGPVMLSETKRFLRENDIEIEQREEIKQILDLKQYVKFSFPFSFFILILSGIVLIFYSLILG